MCRWRRCSNSATIFGVMHALKSDLSSVVPRDSRQYAHFPALASAALARPSLGTAWMAQILSRTAQCTKHNAINGKRIHNESHCGSMAALNVCRHQSRFEAVEWGLTGLTQCCTFDQTCRSLAPSF